MTRIDANSHDQQLGALVQFIQDRPSVFVLTGAGCSTESGIPDYRDADGEWKRSPPMDFRDFASSADNRKRYWARSMVGWPRVGQAKPNAAHHALTRLEQAGRCEQLVTQNVDRLHQQAGSQNVIDLHGRLDRVRCLSCGSIRCRAGVQDELLTSNPEFGGLDARTAPDGDADLAGLDFDAFRVPDCSDCGGILKPDVVFLGESVPKDRVREALNALERAQALLVVGSSLTFFSGFRFALRAAELGRPIASVNLGNTRADHLLSLKVSGACSEVLSIALERAGI